MLRVGGWLGATRHSNASTQSLSALDEPHALQEAMVAAAYILNDDVEMAEAGLSKGNSPFHKLGKGVVAFLRAVLGFEKEIMNMASERLQDAEAAASEHQHRAHRDGYQSSIYPVGSEYALCYAEAQLMSAVIGVLNESLTESIRGFYKLRKAYATLQEISDAEKKYLSSRSSNIPSKAASNARDRTQPSSARDPFADDKDDEDEEEFVDAKEDKWNGENNSLAGEDESDFADITHPIDIFIHSGTNLCFGILQLILSLIPPAFSKLLYIVGFKGDREAGIEMLWRATKYQNINGAIAGLVILGFYNGFIGFCDILGPNSYPKERCRTLLNEMRLKYPQSRLWRLEESRMLLGDKKLEEAVEMTGTQDKSPLKQVEALQWFERSLDCMYLHRYEDCAFSFLKCVELNNWSHGLYYYIAGSCHVELYRLERSKNSAKAKEHAERATELLREVVSHAGKKRFMARQLPFDTFVLRKMQKWEERAKIWKVELVDAVGVSPIEEMIYFWSGHKKMRSEHLETSLARLAWSDDLTLNPGWSQETANEKALLAVLRATTISRLGRTSEAKEILRTDVLSHDAHEFKGGFKDNWILPVAHYEMVVNLWMECGQVQGSRTQLQECSDWLEKAAKWESYDLDARVGLKITTARETLKSCGIVAA
ncbi:hypothetical protein MBLNU459_g1447t1 [Dothideomycetes sp. NU459]